MPYIRDPSMRQHDSGAEVPSFSRNQCGGERILGSRMYGIATGALEKREAHISGFNRGYSLVVHISQLVVLPDSFSMLEISTILKPLGACNFD